MPPKKKSDGASKKNVQKKKEKNLDDKTFGLKNKNKSKKVQAQISAVSQSIMNSGNRQDRLKDEQRKAAKANQKLRKQNEKQERDALFGEALLAVKKKGSTNKKDGLIEAKGRDGNEEEKKGGTSRAMKLMYQMDAQEAEQKLMEDPNYVRTIEDEIESQRQAMFAKIKASGKKLTPVTEESFNSWISAKRKRKEDEVRKRVNAELKKKKGGKGLSVLTGRELYMFNQTLFVDQIEEEVVNGTKDESGSGGTGDVVEAVAEKVQTDLFLEGDDDDLDDLDDLDDIQDE